MTAGSAPSSEKMWGVFTDSMDELVSYRYVGCQAEMLDRDHAVSHTTLRSHLLTPGSVAGATLGISMMDAAGICIDRVQLLGLTEVDLQLYEPALDVLRIRTVGHVVRWARTQVFTECRFEDADEADRVLGVGAANWSVMAPTPEGFEYTDMGPGFAEGPDTPPMTAAFELERADAGGWTLPALSPRVGHEVLHHGPMLVSTEQSALDAAADAAGTDALALRSWSMRIVKAGRKAPFRASAEVLAVTGGVVGTRAELVDGEGDPIAVSYLTHQVR